MSEKAEENSVILVMNRGEGDGKIIDSILKKAGFAVSHASEESETLKLCREIGPAVQLVIIDTHTSGVRLSELLARLHDVNPGIRVLLMAEGSEKEQAATETLPANVRGHLTRPFRRAQLLGSVLEAAKPLARTA